MERKAEEGKRAEWGEREREREEGKKEDDEEVPFQLIRLRVNASSCR